ncbi:MAG: 50S ribosomal protein L24 [Peptococcaceae bacterium]|nr:50S ribosomal protein L24 [Peptococcaceae bacterium]
MAVTKKAVKKQRLHVRKGDTVMVITGNYVGKTGKVLSAIPKKDRVVVEKVNMIKRHTKPSKALPQGGIIEREAPIHVSNVMLYCTECKSVTRRSIKIVGDEKVRVCKKCGHNLPGGK